MYSYGWRDYMPDLGRWHGIDQLAESYHSTSTYAYVANNPVMQFDVDGRWFNEDGSIRPSTTFDYVPGSYKPTYSLSTSGGFQDNSGGGGGAYSFTGNDAAAMFNYFANGGSVSGMTFKNGWAMWGTLEGNPFLEGYDGDMYLSNTGSVILHRAKIGNDADIRGIDFGQTMSHVMWWENTAVSALATGNVPRTGFLKYNELWHATKTRGVSFAWQGKWNNSGARFWRGQQIKSFKGVRGLGDKLTKAGGVLLAADIAMSGEVKTSHLINAGMLALSSTGVGSIIAGAWFIADMSVGAVNYINGSGFKTLSDVIDESTGGPLIEMYDGLY